MDLSEILAISGKPGLYKMLTETKNGVLVESLENQKRFPVFAHEKISSLEEISIFTEDDDMPLKDVFRKIHEQVEGKEAMDHKSDPQKLKAFFLEVVPDYDQERVYNSDIKKVIYWYNQLHGHKLLDFTEEEKEEKAAEKDDDKAKAVDEKD
ncbi:MAG: DUF5606 domain-containing protein [Bacteroidota bacterium]|nr:DUF5606 domain-containing protein [Bacteroidota bacterium]